MFHFKKEHDIGITFFQFIAAVLVFTFFFLLISGNILNKLFFHDQEWTEGFPWEQRRSGEKNSFAGWIQLWSRSLRDSSDDVWDFQGSRFPIKSGYFRWSYNWLGNQLCYSSDVENWEEDSTEPIWWNKKNLSKTHRGRTKGIESFVMTLHHSRLNAFIGIGFIKIRMKWIQILSVALLAVLQTLPYSLIAPIVPL